MARLKTDVPVFRDGMRMGEKVDVLRDYLVQLRSELEFVLHNLSGENFNSAGISLSIESTAREKLGSVGPVGEGIGLQSGRARIVLSDEGTALWYGKIGLRISETGIGITTDGESWREVTE